jgi:hypothetical protein
MIMLRRIAVFSPILTAPARADALGAGCGYPSPESRHSLPASPNAALAIAPITRTGDGIGVALVLLCRKTKKG